MASVTLWVYWSVCVCVCVCFHALKEKLVTARNGFIFTMQRYATVIYALVVCRYLSVSLSIWHKSVLSKPPTPIVSTRKNINTTRWPSDSLCIMYCQHIRDFAIIRYNFAKTKSPGEITPNAQNVDVKRWWDMFDNFRSITHYISETVQDGDIVITGG